MRVWVCVCSCCIPVYRFVTVGAVSSSDCELFTVVIFTNNPSTCLLYLIYIYSIRVYLCYVYNNAIMHIRILVYAPENAPYGHCFQNAFTIYGWTNVYIVYIYGRPRDDNAMSTRIEPKRSFCDEAENIFYIGRRTKFVSLCIYVKFMSARFAFELRKLTLSFIIYSHISTRMCIAGLYTIWFCECVRRWLHEYSLI